MNYIIGIDEVGRGSLAGPIFIGISLSNQKNIENIIKNSPYKITDSKKVTEKRRQEISKYRQIIHRNVLETGVALCYIYNYDKIILYKSQKARFLWMIASCGLC